jgi:hypothetical protein
MKYVSRKDTAIRGIKDAVVRRAYRVAFAGERVAKQHTRVLTGNARRSAHGLVLDESGSVVGGKESDENGRKVPGYSGNGRIQIVVGYNCNYSIHLERLDGMLAAALIAMTNEARTAFQRVG